MFFVNSILKKFHFLKCIWMDAAISPDVQDEQYNVKQPTKHETTGEIRAVPGKLNLQFLGITLVS